MSTHNEEEFKKGLNDILASKEIPFNEADWESAREMLDGARRRRRLVLYFLLPLGLLLIPALVYLLNPESQGVAQNKTGPSSGLSTDATALPEPNTSKTANTPDGSTALNSANPDADKNIPTDNTRTSKPAPEPQTHTTPSLPEPATGKPLKNTTTAPPVATTLPSQQVTATSLAAAPPVAVNAPANGTLNFEVEKSTTTTPVISAVNELPTTLPSQGQAQENTNVPLSKTIAETKILLSTPPVNTSTLPAAENQIAPSLNPLIKPDSVAVAAITPTPDAQGKQPDTSSVPMPVAHPVPETMWLAELGGNYAFGWKDGNKRDGAGFNLLASVYYSNPVTRQISVAYGLQYFALGNMTQNSRTSKVTRYKFAEESDVTVIAPGRADYLAIPVKIGYHADRHNVFGLSFTGAYLVNVQSRVETYHQGMNGKENQQVLRTNGYTEGFSPFVSKAGLFYRRRLAYKWWLQAEAEFGLNDLKNDKLFNLNVKERASGLKLSLIYNFWMIK